jgi:hypothetical protein
MHIIVIYAVGILNVFVFALRKRFALRNKRIYNPEEGNSWWELSISINFGALESPPFWILEFGLRIETARI